MLLIEAIKQWLKECPLLDKHLPMKVDYIDKEESYSIEPLEGMRIVKTYVDGGSIREFPFAFRSREYTGEELARIENSGFYEQFADYLEEATQKGNLPTLTNGRDAISLTCSGWGCLFAPDESSKLGVYQVICKLQYTQI